MKSKKTKLIIISSRQIYGIHEKLNIFKEKDLNLNNKICAHRSNKFKCENNVKNVTFKKILLTGAAGFIGSHVYDIFSEKYGEAEITILDKMTYAADIRNIPQITTNKNHKLIVGDLTDMDICLKATKEKDLVVNLPADVIWIILLIIQSLLIFSSNFIGRTNIMKPKVSEIVK